MAQRRGTPKVWPPPAIGIGPYAPRGDEGRHAGSSCPTGGCGEPPRLPWVAAHSGAFAPAGARDGRESRQRLPQKCPATSDNPSVSLRLTAPFTQGSLKDGGIRPFQPRLPGQRLAKRKARKEQLVKFSLCPIPSEFSTAYKVRRSGESPARAPVEAASTEQDRLEPRPAARQGAPRP